MRKLRQGSTAPVGELTTPFQQAKEEWDKRLGTTKEARNQWRYFALLLLVVCGGTTFWNISLEKRHQDAPLDIRYVHIKEGGEVIGVVQPMVTYKPTDIQMASQLREFIVFTRGLDTNPITVRESWLKMYRWVTPRGATFLNDWAKQRDPFANVGKVFIRVEVGPILKYTENSFHVQWVESIHDIKGPLKEKRAYSGLYTLTVEPPKRDKDLEKNLLDNPTGIKIDTFNVTGT